MIGESSNKLKARILGSSKEKNIKKCWPENSFRISGHSG
jgi:hypothetical protein